MKSLEEFYTFLMGIQYPVRSWFYHVLSSFFCLVLAFLPSLVLSREASSSGRRVLSCFVRDFSFAWHVFLLKMGFTPIYFYRSCQYTLVFPGLFLSFWHVLPLVFGGIVVPLAIRASSECHMLVFRIQFVCHLNQGASGRASAPLTVLTCVCCVLFEL